MVITIPLKAYSVNDFFYADKRHGIKADARQWIYQVNNVLQDYADEFTELRNKFDSKKHGFKVDMTFCYNNFYTKSGEVSSKIFDCSNVEKPLLDLLFNNSNHGKAPYKAPNMNIDDKHVIELNSKKIPGADAMFIKIELIPLPEIGF